MVQGRLRKEVIQRKRPDAVKEPATRGAVLGRAKHKYSKEKNTNLAMFQGLCGRRNEGEELVGESQERRSQSLGSEAPRGWVLPRGHGPKSGSFS